MREYFDDGCCCCIEKLFRFELEKHFQLEKCINIYNIILMVFEGNHVANL